jgi:hypothetical protein
MTMILSTKEGQAASGNGTFPGTYVSHSLSPKIRPPLDDPFTVSPGGGSITVTYTPDPFIFPLQYIDYVNSSGEVVRINGADAWDRVPPPAESPQIVKMQEATGDVFEYTVTVTSEEEVAGEEGSGGEGVGSTYITYTTVFQIEIYADYDVSKETLKAAIDARR